MTCERDLRLEEDEFILYSWATGGDARRIGRRHSDRAKERTRSPHDDADPTALSQFSEGEEPRGEGE